MSSRKALKPPSSSLFFAAVVATKARDISSANQRRRMSCLTLCCRKMRRNQAMAPKFRRLSVCISIEKRTETYLDLRPEKASRRRADVANSHQAYLAAGFYLLLVHSRQSVACKSTRFSVSAFIQPPTTRRHG